MPPDEALPDGDADLDLPSEAEIPLLDAVATAAWWESHRDQFKASERYFQGNQSVGPIRPRGKPRCLKPTCARDIRSRSVSLVPVAGASSSRPLRSAANNPSEERPNAMWALNNRTAYAAERTWVRDKTGTHHWIVCVKASFDLTDDGALSLADEQPPRCWPQITLASRAPRVCVMKRTLSR